MNIFRLCGDMLHLFSIIIMLLKIQQTKSAAVVSLKTQELYLVVFLCRYVDLFLHFISVYNSLMKLFFIGSSAYIVFLMRTDRQVKHTYMKDLDTFRVAFLVGPCVLLALVWNDADMVQTAFFKAVEVLWSFSIYLEAVAILPQLVLFQRAFGDGGTVESGQGSITSHYMFCLGAYRAFYILNWIFRYFYDVPAPVLVWLSGLIQTGIYGDFFYYYLKSRVTGEKMRLPT